MSAYELKVPYGLDHSGRLISPFEAIKDGRQYFCPGCKSSLILKQGEQKTWHFAHKAEANCSGETILHKTAKQLIKQVIDGWRTGANSIPQIARICPTCKQLIEEPIPENITEAEIELRTDSNFIVDVGLKSVNNLVWAVEILVTHAVDQNKADNLGVPFIEIKAENVIESPLYWIPEADGLHDLVCVDCQIQGKKRKQQVLDYRDRAFASAREMGVDMTQKFYRFALIQCWRCKSDIVVFTWPENSPLREPVPSTIQMRYSRMTEDTYMANVCPHCDALQGDFFLYSEPDGPFFKVNREVMNEATFESDMELIFEHVATQ